jgi:ABC-type multidrug transport system fused ATPase/permease subunit
VVLAAFTSYTVIAGHPLTVSKAFVSIEIFSQLQGPMAELPNQIFSLLHAYVSMQRIEAYLHEDEVEDWATSLKQNVIPVPSSLAEENASTFEVGFEQASFKWHMTRPKTSSSIPGAVDSDPEYIHDSGSKSTCQLVNLNIDFPIGQLSLITGPTGSGKSSLLAALLGEMDRVSGKVKLLKANHQVAYAGQFPFLEHATIRDNITYHTPFEPIRYQSVVDACALVPDLAVLDAGDMTGQNTVTISSCTF